MDTLKIFAADDKFVSDVKEITFQQSIPNSNTPNSNTLITEQRI